MSLEKRFEDIESIQFAIAVGIMSGFKVLLSMLDDHEMIQALVSELRHSAENRQKTLQRLLTLLADNPNPQYSHQHEEALIGYLYALNLTDPELAHDAIKPILNTSNLFYLKRLAQHIQAAQTQTP